MVDLQKSRLSGMQDYLALLVRRKWWLIIPFIALSGIAILISLIIPPVFVSDTMILIEPREVPPEIVPDMVTETTDERLNAIEQAVLSRTILLRVLSEFAGGLTDYRGLNDERKVAKIKKRIKLDFPDERRRGKYLPTSHFRISFRDPSPDIAQKVTSRLAALFIEQESRSRESQIFGTTDFLSGEIAKVAQHLKETEDRLKALKQRYRYEMPSELDTNLRTLDRLQVQKTGNLEALDRYTTMELNLERQLAETPALIAQVSAVARNQVTAPPPDPRVEVYKKKELEYKDLITRATGDHPDVKRLKAELDQLKSEIPPEAFAEPKQPEPSAEAPSAMVPNPVHQKLTAQLREIKTEIDIRQREKSLIESEMAKYNERVQNTPRVEQEMAAIQRAYDDLTKQHEDLKTKLANARLAESVESHQKGAQFVVADPASYPLEPSAPNVPMLILLSLIGSLAAAVAAAWLADTLNKRVWTRSEAERVLEVPVLVEIPSIVLRSDLTAARMRKSVAAVVLFAGAAVYTGGLYYLYLRQTALLKVLDPLIERFIIERIAT
ncbi:MAG: hypothetical protein HXY20_07040 [Acidobacteria bacterium]|nr:hypothetical protein [Acidobacteriota bacterium]